MNKIEIQKVSASHGWLWLKHGYQLIMRAPLQAIPLAMMFALGIFLAMLIPIAGVLLAILVMPVLMAGYMRVCRSLEYSEKVEPQHIFAGFKNRTAPLISVGSMLLMGMIVISMVTAAMGGSELSAILENYQAEQDTTALVEALMAPDSAVQYSLLTGLALFFLLMLAMQFAPMLVFFDDMSPRQALQASIYGSIRNIVPFSIYSLLMQLIAFALSFVPMGLGWIVLLPLGLTSMYVAYRDIFSEVKAAITDKENE